MKLILQNKEIPVILANTFAKRLWGLIGKTNINIGMLFLNCNSIHTFLMKENIDVIGLNLENKVIFMERNCSKNKIIKINRKLKETHILELPKNMSQELKLGDKLNLVF